MIIFLIDDNPTNLALIEAVVRKVGEDLEPVCFIDAGEALAAAIERMPDAIAVDYMMPGMDGHEFVRRFRTMPDSESVPIIMITATVERHVRRTALDLGVSEFLPKPIDPYETRARLKTIVSLRRAYLLQRGRNEWLAEEVRKASEALLERERGSKLGLVIADAANRDDNLESVFHFALEQICDFTGWQTGAAAFVLDGVLQPITIRYVLEASAPEAEREPWHQAPLPSEMSVRVAETGVPEWIDVAGDDPGCAATQGPSNACCTFPVLVGSGVGAVLEFTASAPLGMDATRRNIMTQAAMQLGRAIERARAREQLIFSALHDPLTQLPNRVLFTDRLQLAIAARKRNATAGFAVLFIDLDRFKVVNDSLGHLAGDKLLVQVAARLKSSLREVDLIAASAARGTGRDGTLARMGGDEFTILLNGMEDPSHALRVAARIQETLQRPFEIAGQNVYTAASIGIAISSSAYDSSSAVLRDADLAMYRAKSLGRGRSEVFNQAMHEAAMARLQLEADLRRALQNREFVVYYQPIVALQSLVVVGVEALVRWRTPDGELIPPGRFLQVAEETGLIVFLGAWILREACLALRTWDAAFPDRTRLTVSVNVSPREFHEPGFIPQVVRILTETGVDPTRVRLEITENATIGDGDHAVSLLRELRGLGLQLSVDDFGTGYSSLSYLHQFPLNVLKIDRAFVKNVVESSESRDVINSILSLARSMGLEVVAEGAESGDQVAELKRLGCDCVQGFALYRPADVDAITKMLAGTCAVPGSTEPGGPANAVGQGSSAGQLWPATEASGQQELLSSLAPAL